MFKHLIQKYPHEHIDKWKNPPKPDKILLFISFLFRWKREKTYILITILQEFNENCERTLLVMNIFCSLFHFTLIGQLQMHHETTGMYILPFKNLLKISRWFETWEAEFSFWMELRRVQIWKKKISSCLFYWK